jgi:hypothetical protein
MMIMRVANQAVWIWRTDPMSGASKRKLAIYLLTAFLIQNPVLFEYGRLKELRNAISSLKEDVTRLVPI